MVIFVTSARLFRGDFSSCCFLRCRTFSYFIDTFAKRNSFAFLVSRRISSDSRRCWFNFLLPQSWLNRKRLLEPPVPPSSHDHRHHLDLNPHNIPRKDEFHWMQNATWEDVAVYVDQENEYCSETFKQYKKLKCNLKKEMQQLLVVTNKQQPLRETVDHYDYYAYTRHNGLLYCREDVPSKREQVILDTAHFSDTFSSTVKRTLVSDDHRLLAILAEKFGSEEGTLFIKDLTTGTYLQQRIENVSSFAWITNRPILCYTTCNSELQANKVWLQEIPKSHLQPVLIYTESDPEFFVSVGRTKDKEYITINSNSFTTSETHVLSTKQDISQHWDLQLIEPRNQGLQYYVDHQQDHFYIVTNANGSSGYKLTGVDASNPRKENWKDVIVVGNDEQILEVDVFTKHIMLILKKSAKYKLLCYEIFSGQTKEVMLPDDICHLSPGLNLVRTMKHSSDFVSIVADRYNQDHRSNMYNFDYSTPFSHTSSFQYNMLSGELTCIRSHSIKGMDMTKFVSYQKEVLSRDKVTQIPVTILHLKNLHRDRRNPVYITAYGAYGVSSEAHFRLKFFPLLKRGWVIALAHVRGGGEKGTEWHDGGRLLNKKNTFYDFVDAAHYFIENQYTSPLLLAASGVSAGGLVMGYIFNHCPGLFGAITMRAPFLDPLSSMLNEALPLTKSEYGEWGHPENDEKTFRYMSEYAPYDNVETQPTGDIQYPNVFITSSFQDIRVPFWHSLKWVSRVRQRLSLIYGKDVAHYGQGSEKSEAAPHIPPKLLLMMDPYSTHNDLLEENLENDSNELAFIISHVKQKGH